MHRNAEIWEKREARLSAIALKAATNLRQASMGARGIDGRDAIRQRREEWEARFNPIAKRVWNALCVAKGWRRA